MSPSLSARCCLLASVLLASTHVFAQQVDNSETPEAEAVVTEYVGVEPIGAGPFHDPTPPMKSQSVVAQAIARQKMKIDGGDTLHVRIYFLEVDSDLREKIYETIGSDDVVTELDPIPDDRLSFMQPEIPLASFKQATISSPSALSYAIIGADQMQAFIEDAKTSEGSRIMASPQIRANSSQSASVSMISQRPFLVGLNKTGAGETEQLESDLQVLNHGTEVRLVGDFTDRGIQLRVQIQSSEVVDSRTQRVFGFSDDKEVMLQVPLYEVTCVTAGAEVMPNGCLLVDPYLPIHGEEPEKDTSVIQKVSNVVFNSETAPERREPNHMMVLLQPERVASKMNRKTKQGVQAGN